MLFNSGRLADNQTCQKHCRDEIITRVDVLSKYRQDKLGRILAEVDAAYQSLTTLGEREYGMYFVKM